MKILVNRTALIRAITNATGLSPLQDEQRKAMFAKSGRGGGGGGSGSGSRTSTTTTKGGTTTVKTVQTKPAPQPQQPIWDPIAGKWWFPPSKNDPRPTPKPPYYVITDPTRPIMGIPERPPYGSPPPKYYIPVPTPKPQPKPAPKPVAKPSPAPPIYYAPPRVSLPVQPTDPRLLRPWM